MAIQKMACHEEEVRCSLVDFLPRSFCSHSSNGSWLLAGVFADAGVDVAVVSGDDVSGDGDGGANRRWPPMLGVPAQRKSKIVFLKQKLSLTSSN
jgi:hypothetical protein